MEKPDHTIIPNDDIMHLYPSPTTEAYYPPAIARDPDPEPEPEPDIPIDPNMVQLHPEHPPELGSEQQPEHHSPQEHDRRPVVMDESLRLAAELSHKLGDIMKGNARNRRARTKSDQEPVSQHNGPELHSQEGSVDGQDAGVHGQDTAPQNRGLGLHSVAAATAASPAHEAMEYMGAVPAATHIPAHGPIPPPAYFGVDATPPRKRSKVSRACDECRRKKVKCDAGGDIGGLTLDEQCTHCRKSQVQCLFSRVPQKRGPSKG